MRDLKADLAICNAATPGPWEWQENKWWGGHSGMTGKGDVSVLYPNHANDGDDGAAWFDDWENDNDRIFIAAAREGWPHAIERAIKAEVEVTEWQDVAEQRLESHLVVTQKVCWLEDENAKLRKVADAARHVKSAFEAAENYFDKESLYHYHLHDNYCRAEILLFETLEDLEGAIE